MIAPMRSISGRPRSLCVMLFSPFADKASGRLPWEAPYFPCEFIDNTGAMKGNGRRDPNRTTKEGRECMQHCMCGVALLCVEKIVRREQTREVNER